MANVNKVILIGNVTRDPEVKFTPKGTAVTDVGMAINRNYTLDNGEKREDVTFVEVAFWGRQAETIGEYVKKGRSIYVEGRLQLDTWDDKQSGQKRSKLRVVGENFQFLGSRPGGSGGGSDEEGGGHQESRSQRSSRPAPAQQPPKSSEPDDDIPF
ncbi:MAG: single-stranded DNA-binding protein [Terrimicrobiaceae bacterium]|jgi:single-strand DNA-binding protein|nr:single-stranded DNA-binding protein [Terrimicrobiaceae bacterium]